MHWAMTYKNTCINEMLETIKVFYPARRLLNSDQSLLEFSSKMIELNWRTLTDASNFRIKNKSGMENWCKKCSEYENDFKPKMGIITLLLSTINSINIRDGHHRLFVGAILKLEKNIDTEYCIRWVCSNPSKLEKYLNQEVRIVRKRIAHPPSKNYSQRMRY